MPRDDLDEALKEAYASCPSDEVILHTLELRHPSFVDENDNEVPVRVVRDNVDFIDFKNACIAEAKKVWDAYNTKRNQITNASTQEELEAIDLNINVRS